MQSASFCDVTFACVRLVACLGKFWSGLLVTCISASKAASCCVCLYLLRTWPALFRQPYSMKGGTCSVTVLPMHAKYCFDRLRCLDGLDGPAFRGIFLRCFERHLLHISAQNPSSCGPLFVAASEFFKIGLSLSLSQA